MARAHLLDARGLPVHERSRNRTASKCFRTALTRPRMGGCGRGDGHRHSQSGLNGVCVGPRLLIPVPGNEAMALTALHTDLASPKKFPTKAMREGGDRSAAGAGAITTLTASGPPARRNRGSPRLASTTSSSARARPSARLMPKRRPTGSPPRCQRARCRHSWSALRLTRLPLQSTAHGIEMRGRRTGPGGGVTCNRMPQA
jgi:hypothetical protein